MSAHNETVQMCIVADLLLPFITERVFKVALSQYRELLQALNALIRSEMNWKKPMERLKSVLLTPLMDAAIVPNIYETHVAAFIKVSNQIKLYLTGKL